MQARFFDGESATGHNVLLTIELGIVLIRSGGGVIEQHWPLSELVALASPDGSISLRIRSGPARLIIADPATLRTLRHGLRRWPRRQAGWATVLAACVALVGLGITLIDQLPNLLAPLVPSSWETSLGAGVERLLLIQHPRCIGADGQRALQHLVSDLAASADIYRSVTIVVVSDPQVNAFTLPGGRILVMRGLIGMVRDGDELAGVIAHEMGHIAHRDPTRQMLRQIGIRGIEAAVGWGGIDSSGLAGTLLGASYGRAAESGADGFAIDTLRHAGLRADGLEHFFAQTEASGADGVGFLSDHPPTAERRPRTAQPADGAPAFNEGEWRSIRAMCGAS